MDFTWPEHEAVLIRKKFQRNVIAATIAEKTRPGCYILYFSEALNGTHTAAEFFIFRSLEGTTCHQLKSVSSGRFAAARLTSAVAYHSYSRIFFGVGSSRALDVLQAILAPLYASW